jgi:hypothetical protein
MGKNGNRSDNENCRNDYSAVAIKFFHSRDLLIGLSNLGLAQTLLRQVDIESQRTEYENPVGRTGKIAAAKVE